jgi:hypothetical protein
MTPTAADTPDVIDGRKLVALASALRDVASRPMPGGESF